MNVTFVCCKVKREQSIVEEAICIWSQHSLRKIPSLALGVTAFYHRYLRGFGWWRSSSHFTSFVNGLQYNSGLFRLLFRMHFRFQVLPPVRPHLLRSPLPPYSGYRFS